MISAGSVVTKKFGKFTKMQSFRKVCCPAALGFKLRQDTGLASGEDGRPHWVGDTAPVVEGRVKH